MTKTKFKIDFISRGDLNDGIVRMITNHNTGNCKIDFPVFEGYARARFAEWPTVTAKFSFVYSDDETTLMVLENSRVTLVIEKQEVRELGTVAANDEKQGE